MFEFATLLGKLGFVRIKNGESDLLAAEDLSSSVQFGSAGQSRIAVDKAMQTRSFQRDFRLLEEVADAHRARESGR